MSNASTESQATDTGGRNNSARSGKTEGMSGVIDIAPGASAAYRYGARRWIAAGMPPTTEGKKQIMFSGKVYRVDYIRHVRATRDQARLLVDHRIIDFASI